MQHVLDIDLDFFGYEVLGFVDRATRPDPEFHGVWSEADVVDFLEKRCGLTGPLPGFLTEDHDELFFLWRDALDAGFLTAPFHVTHVDAHADLGYARVGHEYLMTQLLAKPVHQRRDTEVGDHALGHANFLAYAIACGWIDAVEYVYGCGGGDDHPELLMENFDRKANNVELKLVTPGSWQQMDTSIKKWPDVVRRERKVPWDRIPASQYGAGGIEFDCICLTRSPAYIPVTADPLYDLIPARYMDVRYQSAQVHP